MLKPTADAAPRDQWTLIRGARQLLTLHGPSGSRRGSAMNEPGVINDGSLLIHNGVIEESGPSRRVENLAQARKARVIDASGKTVMPAFVDPDTVLVFPPPTGRRGEEPLKTTDIRVLSRRRLETAAMAAAAEFARCGILSIGAHTAYADTLRDTVKVLRIHQALQSKPLRIRSIFSPRVMPAAFIGKWLPSVRKRKLAHILELTADAGFSLDELRAAAVAAAGLGYSIRFRAAGELEGDLRLLVVEAGAVAIVAPPCSELDPSCIHVMAVGPSAPSVRALVDHGAALALCSGYRPAADTSFNPQYLLYLAVKQMGLTQEEAIMGLTYNAACALRMSHVTGSLEPGKSADVLIMDVPGYRDLFRRAGHSDVCLVMRAGNVVYRRAGLTVE